MLTLLICVLAFVINFVFWISLDMLDLSPNLHFNASHFFYFSFINQLPSFVLGVYMYNIYVTNKGDGDLIYVLPFIASFTILIFLKYNTFLYGGTIVPFILSLSFVYLFELTRNKIDVKKNIIGAVSLIGKNSYPIYLLNTFVAWELGRYVIEMIDLPDTYVYIMWFPVSILVLYFLAANYNKIITKVNNFIFN